MINKSIAYRISVYISVAVIAVFMAFITLSFYYNRNLLKTNIEKNAIEKSNLIIAKVKKYILTTQEVTSNISNQILFYDYEKKTDVFLKNVILKYKFIRKIHFYKSYHNQIVQKVFSQTPDGGVSISTDNDKKLLYRINLASCSASSFKKPCWTVPYFNENRSEILTANYSPVYISEEDRDTINGLIICELSLSEINDTICSEESNSDGLIVVLDSLGRYIIHPRHDWLLTRELKNLPERTFGKNKELIQEILRKKESKSVVLYPEYWNFDKSWAYITHLSGLNWTLVYEMRYDMLFKPLYITTLRMLFFSVIGILIIYLTITYISNKLIEPLSEVTHELKNFSSNSNELSNTQNEIKLVSDSLLQLRAWYEHQKNRLSDVQKSSDKILEDIQIASEIQKSLIKTAYPVFQGRRDIDLYTVFNPAHIVSGDLYDYFFTDEENLLFMLGDVSGKGIAAAVFMGVSQAVIKGSVVGEKAGLIVAKANDDLSTYNQHQFFLTLFLGILNVKTLRLNYCNAAHSNAVILKTDGEITELKPSHGLPLGLYPKKEYKESTIQLHKGDTIIIFSDGFTDQLNNENNHFGIKKLYESIRLNRNEPVKYMVDSLVDEIKNHSGELPQTDDMSLIALRILPNNRD